MEDKKTTKMWKYRWDKGKLIVEPPDHLIRNDRLTEEGETELKEIIRKQRIPHMYFTISQILVIISFLLIAWALSLWLIVLLNL